ncbi:MAG TPA: hypothetical protein VH640_03065 [Bryobacteraceae bacterium]|jgi:uncharacterized protein YcfJ
MNFTSKMNPGAVARRLLSMVVLGSVGLAVAPAQTVSVPGAPVVPAVEVTPQAISANILPVTHWYKNKHWWKKNAPVVGGAAGGALIGGLAGGGKGLLIGGAVGGGGGYLYKRLNERHHRHEAQKRYREQQRYRSASASSARHTHSHRSAE